MFGSEHMCALRKKKKKGDFSLNTLAVTRDSGRNARISSLTIQDSVVACDNTDTGNRSVYI